MLTLMTAAFEQTWFFVLAIVLGVFYGFGGLVHVGNMLGFGEMKWSESPRSWKIGDLWWGSLDLIAVIGIVLQSPIGLLALMLAALSQTICYAAFPQVFAARDEHLPTLRGLAWFNGVVLIVIAVAIGVAGQG